MLFKSVVFRSVLTVFLAKLLPLTLAAAAESRPFLHVPWAMFETELQSAVQSGQLWRGVVGNTSVTADGMVWQLKGLRFDAQVRMDRPLFNGHRLTARLPQVSARISIDELTIDHIIEREVENIPIRVRVQASCGPIRLIQERATAETEIGLVWTGGSPVSSLKQIEISWAPDSWVISEFSCTGPQGLDTLLRAEILKRSKQAADFKPFLTDWMAGELQSRLQSALTALKNPVNIVTGEGQLPLRGGTLVPGVSGLYAELMLGSADEVPTPQPKLPSEQHQAQLPADRPALIGQVDVLESLLNVEMRARPDLLTVDLQNLQAFQSLLRSRFLQFFLWPDLFNYDSKSPFYVRLKTPRDLKLAGGAEGQLITTLPIQAVMQSKRDGRWWDYLNVNGTAGATIQLKVSEGVFSYQTSISSPRVSIGFSPVYQKQYRPSNWLPTSSIRDAMEGPQSALSGSLKWPDVDLGVAGKYRAQQLGWLDRQTFVMSWRKLP